MIKLKFFASLRETIGLSELDIEDMQGHSIEQVQLALVKRGEPWDALARQDILFAVNHSLCAPETILNAGDELAMFPPVTGG